MRVLCVTHRFLPRYVAGTEVYTAALSRGLAEHGHAVQIFSGDPSATSAHTYEWNGLPVRAVPWGLAGKPGPIPTFLASFGNPGVERRFAQQCAEFRPEIVHIHHLMGLSPHLIAIAHRYGARVVVTLHDYWFVCSNTWLFRWNGELCPGPGWGYHCGGCALDRLGRKPQPLWMSLTIPLFAARTHILRRSLFSADRLIAPSQTVARAIAGHGIPANRIQVIPHGLSERPVTIPEKPAPKTGPLHFAYVGSLTPPKGAHIAVEAFNALSIGTAWLDIYGDLSADPGYVAELRLLAQHPGIRFQGPVIRSEMREVWRAMDVLLVPSLWREPFGIVVDEALEAGVPLIVSDHGALTERLIPGVNGLAAPPGDVAAWRQQMQRLLEEPELLAQLRSGIRPPKRLSFHLTEIENVYTVLLSS